MTTKLARQEAIAKTPPMDAKTQTFVNAVFLNMVLDPFLNGELLLMAAISAGKQLDMEPEQAEKMLKKLVAFHRKAQGPVYGFMP